MEIKDKKTLSRDELYKREKAVVERICSDDKFAYFFFHEKCRPLFSNILWTVFSNNSDYDELVNELYIQLKKPNSDGEMWHALKTYDYRTSLFDWIKIVAVRIFYTPNKEIFVIPDSILETGIFEEMVADINKAIYRKFLWFKYVEKIEDEAIVQKLSMERSQLTQLSRKAIRQLKLIIENKYPEYIDILFYKDNVREVFIEETTSLRHPLNANDNEAALDVYKYLDSMPNESYRHVIKSLFIDDMEPEQLAKELNTPLSNIYNLKSRGLDQLRDLAIYFNEISNLDKYINLISDDRKRDLLMSIYVERKDYESVCSKLNITEVQLKKIKKDAMKELKNKIFKAKS